MENENENAQEVVVEQEEQTTEGQGQDQITLSKAEYNKLTRKAIAYDTTKKQPKEIINNNPSLKPIDILRDDAFKLYREGYDEKEIDVIINNGGRKILEDKDNPITLGIAARMEQRRAEQAVNGTSNSSSQLSEVERKYTPEMLKNMSTKELENILPHA